jgi:hypothetical protein
VGRRGGGELGIPRKVEQAAIDRKRSRQIEREDVLDKGKKEKL